MTRFSRPSSFAMPLVAAAGIAAGAMFLAAPASAQVQAGGLSRTAMAPATPVSTVQWHGGGHGGWRGGAYGGGHAWRGGGGAWRGPNVWLGPGAGRNPYGYGYRPAYQNYRPAYGYGYRPAYGYNRPYYRPAYGGWGRSHYGYGYDNGGAVAAGLIGGALLGTAIAAVPAHRAYASGPCYRQRKPVLIGGHWKRRLVTVCQR